MLKKSLALMAFAAFTALQAEAAPIAEWVMHEGFSPDPKVVTIALDDSGEVTATEVRHNGAPVVRYVLTQENPAELANLRATIDAITDEALVDPQADQPHCADAPITRTRVYRNGSAQPMDIELYESCHRHYLLSWTNGPRADQVIAKMDEYRDLYLQELNGNHGS